MAQDLKLQTNGFISRFVRSLFGNDYVIEHSGIELTAEVMKSKLLDVEVKSNFGDGTAFAVRNRYFSTKKNSRLSMSASTKKKTENPRIIKCYKCKA